MRRLGEILCRFGAGEVAVAAIVFFLFVHLPYPWGTATLPVGLVGVAEERQIESTEAWQAHFVAGVFGIGVCGIVFLIAGVLALAFSKTRHP